MPRLLQYRRYVGPTVNAIGPEAVLDATATPLTVTVPVASSKVGVTVTELVELGTLDV